MPNVFGNKATMIHFITACSRPKNLPKLKASILSANRAAKNEIVWHICFDAKAVSNPDIRDYQDPFIRLYSASTYFHKNPGKSQVNFVLTHFKLNMFDGFVYILDDDNVLPDNFLSHAYNEAESLIYLFPQLMWSNKVKQAVLRDINPVTDEVDQAQMLVHSSLHKMFYPLCYNGDGMVIEALCKEHPYKVINIPVYYNRLSWPE